MEGTRQSWPASGKTWVGLELLPRSDSGAVAVMIYYFPRCRPRVPMGTLQRLCLSVASSLQMSNPFAGVALETNLLFWLPHFPEQIQGRNPQTTGASEPDRGREEARGSDAAAAAGVGAVPVLRRPAQEAGVGTGADAKSGDPGAGGADRRERSVLLVGAPQPRAAGRVRRPAAEERGGPWRQPLSSREPGAKARGRSERRAE